MASGHIYLDRGTIREGKTRVPGASRPASPISRTIVAYPGETLASITQRAYGANTAANRDKITSANHDLKGTINVP